MSAAATHQSPTVPPRPSRTMDKEGSDMTGALPKIPPRPAQKRFDRSVSPNPDRFAPSPLCSGVSVKTVGRSHHLGSRESLHEAVDRSGGVAMPSVGEEGVEYSAVAAEIKHEDRRSSSPEQTRTVGEDLKLHAPKPSLPAASAKQQVMAVTRTDSDRAASFGIGRPGSTAGERSASRNSNNRKRPGSSYSAHSDHHTDDEHGIPEIGQRVPMNPHLGDVQAPSPGPGATPDGAAVKRHHGRKHSARGLPPGSYGLHGHGVASQDRLEKAYYQKHPEVLEREQHVPLHDRQNDFAMSSTDLNRLVRDTANRNSAPGTAEVRATPTEEVAYHASEEYTSRISSRPASTAPPQKAATDGATITDDEKPIHVDDARHPEIYSCGDEDNAAAEDGNEYSAPILAPDQVSNDPGAQLQHPAIHPHPDRRDSFDSDEPSSRPTSRSGHNRAPSYQRPEFGSTPLEDVEEYEPLFSEEVKDEGKKQDAADENHLRHHFPSRDIWEDAPSSVHYTAEVSTPEQPEQAMRRPSAQLEDRSITPAQAFAQYQEQLAEEESSGRTNSLPPADEKPTWISHQPHLSPKKVGRPQSSHRFPSRDVWEETPESQLQEAVVSASPTAMDNSDSASQPTKRSSDQTEPPAIPERPKPRQSSGESSAKPKPPVSSDKPKPSVPPRPIKTSPGDSRDASAPKTKPAVPTRPVGSKIAALQAGFMSDLNKRLQLGPQAPKKEAAEDEAVEDKEKAPLSDARKGRARGPQRRAPAAKPAAAASTPSAATAPTISLTFSMPQTSWSVDPDDGDIAVGTENEATPDTGTETEEGLEVAQADEARMLASDPSQPTLAEKPQATDVSHDTIKAGQAHEQQTLTPQSHPENGESAGPEAKEEPVTVGETLAANMAGESVLEATVEKATDGAEVEPVEVHDKVKA